MSGKECKTLSLFVQQPGSQISMPQPNLSIIGNTAWNTETLESNAYGFRCISSSTNLFLDGDSRTDHIRPFSIFKADALCFLAHLIGIDTCFITYFIGLFNAMNVILAKGCKNLRHATILTFKIYYSHHDEILPFILYVDQ